MSLAVKLTILLAVLVSEIVVCGLVGLRLARSDRLPAALAVAASGLVTLVVVAVVLFLADPSV